MTLTTEKLIFLAENAHFEVHQGWTASIVPVTLYTRGKEEGRICSSVNKTFSTVCLRFFCSYVFCFFLVVWLIFFLGGAFFFFLNKFWEVSIVFHPLVHLLVTPSFITEIGLTFTSMEDT